MSAFLRGLRELFFPPKCGGCRALLDEAARRNEHAALCTACAKKWNEALCDLCEICGQPLTRCACMTRAMAEAKCADMRVAVLYRHGRRDAVQNRLLFHIKNQRSDAVPRFLADALASSVEELLVEYDLSASDCILTYLPRSHAARLEYGTDQAEAIAKALSLQTGIGFARLILRNRLHNRSQKELSPTARMKNAKAAFRLHPKADVKGKYLFLVDDIITTGAGMAVGTRLLRRAGAKAVFCLAVARDDGIPDRDLVPK